MDAIMILIFLGIMAAVGLIIFFAKKYNVQSKDLDGVLMIMTLADYITKQYKDFPYSKGILTIIDYVLEAVEIVKETEDEEDILVLKQYIIDESIKICMDNNIEVDDNLQDIVNEIIDFILTDK